MRTKRFLAVVTITVLVGGCADQVKRLEPKLELRNAGQHLADAKQVGFTVKLTGSVDDLIAGLKIQAARDKGSDSALIADDITAVRTYFRSSVRIAYDQAGAGADDDRMLLSATVDGLEGTEIRVVDKTLYAKAPMSGLAEKFGAADFGQSRKEVTTGSPELGAFFDGKWVATDAGLAMPNADAGKFVAELKTSASNLFRNAAIARDPADAKHLVVTSSTARAYAELMRLITAVGESGPVPAADAGDAPKDHPIVLDLWIDGGKLTALEVNLLQFIDGATGRTALRLDMTTGEQIAVPPNATKIDPAELTALRGDPGDDGPDTAVEEAEHLGYDVRHRADEGGGEPANYLKEAIADLDVPGVTARVVRRGTAGVAFAGTKACLTLPSRSDKELIVVKHAC